MSNFLTRALDRFIGRGSAAVTVPPLDGAFRPNRALEEAPLVAEAPAPDNLVGLADGRLAYFTSGATLWRLDGPGARPAPAERFEEEITALALDPSGALALGLEQGRILIRGGPHDGMAVRNLDGRRLMAPTALAFSSPDRLLVAQGSGTNPPQAWARDLMERNASGSLWHLDLKSGAAICLADRLAFPAGIRLHENGERALVSEAWRHRLLEISTLAPAEPKEILADLPGYPSRLSAAPDGGAWLCLFAPRSQLIEFVLREKTYRTRMMEEVDPEYWLAPALASNRSFLEPLQGGGVKQMGILKPWAPTRSYGLVARLDAKGQPVASFHSRADGSRHGVTSALEQAGRLYVTAKGGDAVLGLGLRGESTAFGQPLARETAE